MKRRIYISVKIKFIMCLLISVVWLSLCTYLSLPWIRDLANYISIIPAIIIVFSIALMPGFMYMFLVSSYLLDKRKSKPVSIEYPPVTVLVAAYNEELSIIDTLLSIKGQKYPGLLEIILIDDGSKDTTVELANSLDIENLRVIQAEHGGKANALNIGLEQSSTEYIATIDADTYLLPTAIKELMFKLLTGPQNTVACAGSVYVKNSRENMITKIQEWDYFHSIAAIKRSQSLFQGTLVAQGAFSVYTKSALIETKGWENVVGEDIVLTWDMLSRGHRIDFAELAISFTTVPNTYKQFFLQRSRWARGMLEAFRRHPKVLIKPRFSTFYIYWNLFFILFDTVFFSVFIPGVIVALFGYFYIAGPMTLAVIPLGILNNLIFFVGQKSMFKVNGLKVRRNVIGFLVYALFYQFIMNPAVIFGYLSELFNKAKVWGTK